MTRTLVVTIESDSEFEAAVSAALEALAEGSSVDDTHTVSVPNETVLAETFTATTLSLLRVLAKRQPASIRETARVLERDVKNVHEELTRLEAMGVLRFEAAGQAKRPVFPYDELVIDLPLGEGSGDAAVRS